MREACASRGSGARGGAGGETPSVEGREGVTRSRGMREDDASPPSRASGRSSITGESRGGKSKLRSWGTSSMQAGAGLSSNGAVASSGSTAAGAGGWSLSPATSPGSQAYVGTMPKRAGAGAGQRGYQSRRSHGMDRACVRRSHIHTQQDLNFLHYPLNPLKSNLKNKRLQVLRLAVPTRILAEFSSQVCLVLSLFCVFLFWAHVCYVSAC